MKMINRTSLTFLISIICSVFLSILIGSKSDDLINMLIAPIFTLTAIQVAAFSLVVSLIDTNALKKVDIERKRGIAQKLEELFDSFGQDTRYVFWFAILMVISYFAVHNSILHPALTRAISFFSIITVLFIIFESIDVILKIGKTRID